MKRALRISPREYTDETAFLHLYALVSDNLDAIDEITFFTNASLLDDAVLDARRSMTSCYFHKHIGSGAVRAVVDAAIKTYCKMEETQ